MIENVALVLEGGGFRGCYTAGAMKWLHDNGVLFKYSVSISATAVHSFFYLTGRIDEMHEMTVKSVTDPKMIGLSAILTEGNICAFEYMKQRYVLPPYRDALKDLLNSDIDYEMGVYNMTSQRLEYKNKYDLDPEANLLKASCTLPISGKMTDVDGSKYLDGGIDTMVSVKRAQEKGYDKMLVIVTKDKNYVRKPNGFFLTLLLRLVYHNYPDMLATLDKRTEAYYSQMDSVYELEREGKGILIRPTRDCGVKRFSGSEAQLEEMFQLGWQDMEDRREEILSFLGINKQ